MRYAEKQVGSTSSANGPACRNDTVTYSLAQALSAYHREDAFEVRLHVTSDRHSVLLLRRPALKQQWIEARAADGSAIKDTDRECLKKLGMRRRRFHGGGRAMGLELDHELSPEKLGEHMDRVLSALGAASADTGIHVSCQREQPPENPKLVEAMRAAAVNQDGGTRQRLYAALVNATLLVPIDPTGVGRPEHEQEPLLLEPDVMVAFTDWDAIRQWSAHGHPFGLVYGVDFFGHAADRGATAVRVNPEGIVGGQLFASEVQMMAEAVRGYLKSQR